MLKNAPTLAIVAVHTEENEPSRVLIRNNTIINTITVDEMSFRALMDFEGLEEGVPGGLQLGCK